MKPTNSTTILEKFGVSRRRHLLFMATIAVMICGVVPAFGVSLRLGGEFYWGPDRYFADGEELKPLLTNHSYTDYRDTATLSISPLMGAHVFTEWLLLPKMALDLGIAVTWKQVKERFMYQSSSNRSELNFSYVNMAGESGLLYVRESQSVKLRAGGFVSVGLALWNSSAEDYDKNGKKLGEDDFWGLSGSTPFGLNGDKKTNSAAGLALGGGIRGGGEYRLSPRIGVFVEGSVRFNYANVRFSPDYHMWEDTESYQDIHSEILFGKEIATSAMFSIIPSMFGVTSGITIYAGQSGKR